MAISSVKWLTAAGIDRDDNIFLPAVLHIDPLEEAINGLVHLLNLRLKVQVSGRLVSS